MLHVVVTGNHKYGGKHELELELNGTDKIIIDDTTYVLSEVEEAITIAKKYRVPESLTDSEAKDA